MVDLCGGMVQAPENIPPNEGKNHTSMVRIRKREDGRGSI
jgi:hypothetical protein